MKNVSNYLTEVMLKQKTGIAREHAYRPAFQQLIKSLKPELNTMNDPARSEHGAPDFVFLKGDLTVGYAETKNIGADLNKEEKSEQLKRYFGYPNLILTNYLDFRFYINGERYGEPISIGLLSDNIVVPNNQNFEILEHTIKDFLDSKPEKIKSGTRLAKIMAGKARRIRENVFRYISDKSDKSKELLNVYGVMKKLLVHDLSPDQFADMYAQTLVYGLFVARYHDKSEETFTRQEARDLVPVSNPLLRHFFDHIVGPDFDKRLSYIVNELCEVFSAADVKKIMDQYYSKTTLWGETKESPDPVIHFYEDFLREYDSEQRIKLGAFYTPLPVVRFIVKSIDSILKNNFALFGGLSDTKKIEISKIVQGKNVKETLHEVQILDPAVGTGTFLNEIVIQINKGLKNQEGRFNGYVENDLLPRLHGFELMMAPYTIAHLKLGMTLRKFGYENISKRIGIYLTNSIEEAYKLEGTLFEISGFMHSITEESREASKIKNERPIMVVLGNPPYSISSSNKGAWIQNLIKDYKKDLNEQNLNALSDDYIKFIRFAEHFIEKSGRGVVAMITNNSYIGGIVHRQMRKHLLETFDDIYILDLHGNMRKGEKDQNVFDIQQGVSIGIFVKNKNRKGPGKIHHAEYFGSREEKYDKLGANSVETLDWKELECKKPYYFFIPKDFSKASEYNKGFGVNEIFNQYGSGVKFRKDNLLVKKHFDPESVKLMLDNMQDLEEYEIYKKYDFSDTKDWKLIEKKQLFFAGDEKNIKPVSYRPFDTRYTYYPPQKINQIIPRGDSRKSLMKNLLKDNVGLSIMRGSVNTDVYSTVFVVKNIMELNFYGFQTYVFPLYEYAAEEDHFLVGEAGSIKTDHISNMSISIARKIAENVGAVWYPVSEYPTKKGDVRLTPENIFDYIYAVLYSPSYREKYKEFLKIDFPRIPYPKNEKIFRGLAEKGRELRLLHLMESPKLQNLITTYPKSGSNIIEKVDYKNGNVYINENQYFGNVPEIAWNFYIGGRQPAQKWLKDRKDRRISNEDLEHYQQIIVALVETDKIMKEVDKLMYINL